MPIDIRSLKWENWVAEDPKPSWPVELTKKYWDKKKGLIAKATATGIGAQLETTNKAFVAALGQAPVFKPRNMDEFPSAEKRALAFATGSTIKRLHGELKKLRDTAEKAKVTYQKSKAPGLKSTLRLCAEIEIAADHLMVACNPNSMKGYVATTGKENAKRIHAAARRLAKPTLDNCRTVPAKAFSVLGDLEKSLDELVKRDKAARRRKLDEVEEQELEKAWDGLRSTFKNELFTIARDMTQPIVNIRKAMQAGLVFEGVTPDEIERLKKLLVPYGNGDAANCKGADERQMRKKLATLRKGAEGFDAFAGSIKLTTL